MLGIAATGKLRILRPARQNSVRAEMNVIAAIFFVQNLAVPGHEHRDGVRQQEHFRRQRSGEAVGTGMLHAGIFQIHRIHEVVQGDVGVTTAQTREQGSSQAKKGVQGIAPEGAEEEVKPHNIRFQLIHRCENSSGTAGIVERPATLHGESLQLRLMWGYLIRKNIQAEKRIAAQFFRNMQAVLAKPSLTGREGAHQTNFHSYLDTTPEDSMRLLLKMLAG
jgi:hypothetical protein